MCSCFMSVFSSVNANLHRRSEGTVNRFLDESVELQHERLVTCVQVLNTAVHARRPAAMCCRWQVADGRQTHACLRCHKPYVCHDTARVMPKHQPQTLLD
jgi:hypothetical protein